MLQQLFFFFFAVVCFVFSFRYQSVCHEKEKKKKADRMYERKGME